MTLLWHGSGPLIRYRDGCLEIEDLNPEVKTKWTMSKLEMFIFGWRCLLAAL